MLVDTHMDSWIEVITVFLIMLLGCLGVHVCRYTHGQLERSHHCVSDYVVGQFAVQ
jgi:hypothetical protein